ncbi:hypothetical protein Sj15T_03300 [Sphingobium sp. TA15]|uniref:Uncharacterized protein n=2 Tax=Sphingobium indicum TaxID=332055 RepID=D4Z065_SPHIU|nr:MULTISPECIES: hypothetical protein [Sphingobium]EPR17374.1 hypothetical protein M527_17045 [Sphingobium indicum IP26]BDD65309.1 hypothetical protein Sj15T_03300 [Sphingobium sp. TA15]EQA99576.1 hypothetical protein L286_19445 [Sphingobium sp. HDIP04]KER37398.1 hypothetical protein AL00_05480 [Sphingobium indicum F2]BAI95997.1 hypothetical protein SJA_C1-11630 [Sphingobium indicum UT26S]
MIRTLIFGAIAGYVGKKLYDEGKLTEFKDDLVARYNQAKSDLDQRRDSDTTATSPNLATPAASTTGAAPLTP